MDSFGIIGRLSKEIGISVDNISVVKGGLTNETYLVSSAEKKYIARIAGEGTEKIINREDECYNMNIGAKLGISPMIYSYYEGNFLMEYVDAKTIKKESELLTGNVLEQIVEALVKLHTSGAKLHNEYSILDNIKVYKSALIEMNASLPPELLEHEEELHSAVEWMVNNIKYEPVSCLIDTIWGNILISKEGVKLIDWEYSGMSDYYCDLVHFSLFNDLSEEMEKKVLDLYFLKREETLDYSKYLLYKMALSYMWVYWHLVKYEQYHDVEYNNRRWRERLQIALESKRKWELMNK